MITITHLLLLFVSLGYGSLVESSGKNSSDFTDLLKNLRRQEFSAASDTKPTSFYNIYSYSTTWECVDDKSKKFADNIVSLGLSICLHYHQVGSDLYVTASEVAASVIFAFYEDPQCTKAADSTKYPSITYPVGTFCLQGPSNLPGTYGIFKADISSTFKELWAGDFPHTQETTLSLRYVNQYILTYCHDNTHNFHQTISFRSRLQSFFQ